MNRDADPKDMKKENSEESGIHNVRYSQTAKDNETTTGVVVGVILAQINRDSENFMLFVTRSAVA